MDALARLIDNPNRVASHTDLPDSDPVKIAACRAAERFEAATNGMDGDFAVDRGGQGESPADRAFRPWRELTSAIEAFYRGDEAAMLEAGRRIPDGTPPAALKSLFRRLAGVESLSALLGQTFQGDGQVRLAQQGSRRRHLAAG